MRKSLEERFWPKVDKTESCWLWLGAKSAQGYGILRIDRRNALAHRISWELANGQIPSHPTVPLVLCHTCDVRNCVRPTHLFLGDSRANAMDRERKGRGGHVGINYASSRGQVRLCVYVRKEYAAKLHAKNNHIGARSEVIDAALALYFRTAL